MSFKTCYIWIIKIHKFIHAFLYKESKVVEIWERLSSNALTKASKIGSDKFFENFKS
jgi:hypothetical protein